MSKLREAARGRPCMVRYPNICNGRTDTTVLAHVRLAGITGAGQKGPDEIASWACDSCHSEYDRRTRKLELSEAKLGFYEGVMRTLYALIKEGKL